MFWPRSSHGLPLHVPCLLHIPTSGLHVGRYPPQPVSVLGPATTLSSSLLLTQAIFEPNIFPYKYCNIFKPNHPSYLSVYEDGTECFETSEYKIQTPGNYPEQSIQHWKEPSIRGETICYWTATQRSNFTYGLAEFLSTDTSILRKMASVGQVNGM